MSPVLLAQRLGSDLTKVHRILLHGLFSLKGPDLVSCRRAPSPEWSKHPHPGTRDSMVAAGSASNSSSTTPSLQVIKHYLGFFSILLWIAALLCFVAYGLDPSTAFDNVRVVEFAQKDCCIRTLSRHDLHLSCTAILLLLLLVHYQCPGH